MEHKHTASLTLGGLLCLAVVVALSAYHVSGLDRNITRLIETYESKTGMQTLTEDVETQSGRTITVTTVRLDGESASDFAARHDEAVQAAKLL